MEMVHHRRFGVTSRADACTMADFIPNSATIEHLMTASCKLSTKLDSRGQFALLRCGCRSPET